MSTFDSSSRIDGKIDFVRTKVIVVGDEYRTWCDRKFDDRCELRRDWGKWYVDKERNRLSNDGDDKEKRIEIVRRVYGTNERQDTFSEFSSLSSWTFDIDEEFKRFRRDERNAFTWQEGTEWNLNDKLDDFVEDLKGFHAYIS